MINLASTQKLIIISISALFALFLLFPRYEIVNSVGRAYVLNKYTGEVKFYGCENGQCGFRIMDVPLK